MSVSVFILRGWKFIRISSVSTLEAVLLIKIDSEVCEEIYAPNVYKAMFVFLAFVHLTPTHYQ